MVTASSISRRRAVLRYRIALRFKAIRIGRRVSQSEVAKAAGVSTSEISRFEAGQREPSLTQAILIMERLKIWTIDVIVPPGAGLPPERRRVGLGDDLGEFYGEYY